MGAKAKAQRLIEFIRRAIPYSLLLVSANNGSLSLSVAHMRWSQSEGGKIDVRQISLNFDAPSNEESVFLESIAVSRLPARDLFVLYGG